MDNETDDVLQKLVKQLVNPERVEWSSPLPQKQILIHFTRMEQNQPFTRTERNQPLPDDEMDDVLKQLENGENPSLNALKKEKKRDAETAAKFRAISKMAFALGVAAVAGGLMTIGKSVFSLVGAIAGGALLSMAAGAWAVSSLYTTNDNQDI